MVLKSLCIVMLLCMTALTVSAQWSVGVKGGWDYTTITRSDAGRIDESYSGFSGFDAGIQARYGFTEWFALRADLSFMRRSHRMDRNLNYLDPVFTNHHNYYLMLPALADFSFGEKICVVMRMPAAMWATGFASAGLAKLIG